jgi:hypothetical protein
MPEKQVKSTLIETIVESDSLAEHLYGVAESIVHSVLAYARALLLGPR